MSGSVERGVASPLLLVSDLNGKSFEHDDVGAPKFGSEVS